MRFPRQLLKASVLLTIGVVTGVAVAQTLPLAKDSVAPMKMPPVAPTGPSTKLDLTAQDGRLQGIIPSVNASISLVGQDIGIGGYMTLGKTSNLAARVFTLNTPGNVAPPGTYRVRFKFLNVNTVTSVALTSGSLSTTCQLAALPGYNNVQTCDLVVATTGSAISVLATPGASTGQITIGSVELYKEK